MSSESKKHKTILHKNSARLQKSLEDFEIEYDISLLKYVSKSKGKAFYNSRNRRILKNDLKKEINEIE